MKRHARIPFLLTGLLLLPGGCAPPVSAQADDGHSHGTEWPARAVTIWTDRFEYFIEHDLPVPGRESEFVVHVSNLADGSPRTSGTLIMTFDAGGTTIPVPLSAPNQPGIYLTAVTLPESDDWRWELDVDGDRPELPAVAVYANEHDAQHAAEGTDDDGISLLKEQQWASRLRVERASRQPISGQIPVMAHVDTAVAYAATIAAPGIGSLEPAGDRPMARLGQTVAAGEVLGTFRMPLLGGDLASWDSAGVQRNSALAEATLGLANAQADLERTRAELELAESVWRRTADLHTSEAKSDRELEVARFQRESARAANQAAEGTAHAWSEALSRLQANPGSASALERAYVDIELRTPVAGVVIEAPFTRGESIEPGEHLFEIADVSVLQVEAHVPEADLADLSASPQGMLSHPNGAEWAALPGPDGRVLLAAPIVDPETRAGHVVFEIPNPGWLRAGMTLEATLATGPARDALTIATSALVDEDGVYAVYIQTAGETFTRRLVRTGVRAGDRVEILDGLTGGEQVVVNGAYVVRLASQSGVVLSHGHAH